LPTFYQFLALRAKGAFMTVPVISDLGYKSRIICDAPDELIVRLVCECPTDDFCYHCSIKFHFDTA
jgi:hypothetical protein